MVKIIDAHCHVYPDKIAAKATEAIGQFYGLEMKYNGTVQKLLEIQNENNISKSLITSVSTTPSQVRSINEYISGVVKQYPTKFIGFGTLHPDSEDIEGDLEHLMSLNLKGVKLHPDFQRFAVSSEKGIKLCATIAGKLPVLIHAGDKRQNFSNPDQIRKLMEHLPDLVVIAAHFGGWSEWNMATEQLAGMPNLYVDCSSSFYALSDERIRELVSLFGEDKVLWGTDYPMWDVKKELDRFLDLGFNSQVNEKILYNNVVNLLGIS